MVEVSESREGNMKKLIILFVLIIFIIQLFSDNSKLEKKFNEAKSQIKSKDFIKDLEELAGNHVDTYYGQLSLLELAKINLLERKYENAIFLLKKISDTRIDEKEYWLAKAYLKAEDYNKAIISAQNFISDFGNDSEKTAQIETAYFIIIESYFQQNLFKRALSNLEFLRTSKFIYNNIPLLHYKIGLCNEKLKKYENALLSYKKLKMDFPYHQYNYLAEDRIFNLQNGDKIDIDFKKINSYRKQETETRNSQNSADFKLYLQVGAFSSEKNAKKLGERIKKLGYKYILFTKKVNNKTLTVVAVGDFKNDKELGKAAVNLEKNGISSFVLKRK